MENIINNYGLIVSTYLVCFFSDLQPILWSLGFLIMTDTGLAIWASWKMHGASSIKSRKLGRIITKTILYPLAIIVAKVSEDYLAPDIPWLKITTGIVASVEIKSIFEKMNDLLGFNLWNEIRKAIWKNKIEETNETKNK